MDCLLNKPTYKYKITTNSKVSIFNRVNCCFISSFQIQMKKQWNDFLEFEQLLDLLYLDEINAYTNFADDFPVKWNILKKYLISTNLIWESRLNSVVLRICLPLNNDSKCVLLDCIDINIINCQEITDGNYDSLEASFSDTVSDDKVIINIIQLYNHFEPIDIIESVGVLNDISELSNIKHFF